MDTNSYPIIETKPEVKLFPIYRMNYLRHAYYILSLVLAFFNLTLASAESEVEEIFEIYQVDQNNIGFSEIWGEVDLSNDPWIRTDTLGWVYLYSDSSPTGYWIWVNGLGWLNSSVGKFPNAYLFGATRFEDGDILLDLLERKVFRYYHYDTRRWREHGYKFYDSSNPITLVQQKLHSKVPEEYVGIAARNPRFIDRTYSEILIGPYYLIRMEAFV